MRFALVRWGMVAVAMIGMLGGCLRSPLQRGSTATETANAVGWYAGGSNMAATREWLRIHPRSRTVDVTMVAELTRRADLNGYRNGLLTVSVPQGWRVKMHFRNHSATAAHSLKVVRYNSDHRWTNEPIAIRGASTPNPSHGVPPGGTADFSFPAQRPGHYVLTCAVPGHRERTMWANLVITSGQHEPRIWVRVDG